MGSATADDPERRRRGRARRRPGRARSSVALALGEPRRTLQALRGAGNVAPLQLLEVRDPGHDVVALGRVVDLHPLEAPLGLFLVDRKSTRLNSSHVEISYAVFCLK